MSSLKVSVVVPSYLRPLWLKRCLTSLVRQTRLSDEIIVVMRDTDADSHQAFAEVLREWPLPNVPLRSCYVQEPGFLPPLDAGRRYAIGDIVCYLDDDAEAHPTWLEKILSHYTTDDVGAVGGRCVTLTQAGQEVLFAPPKKNASRLSWYGRIETNMYRDLTTQAVQEAICLMGGNCSYRREVLTHLHIDPMIANRVAYNWELDWGLQVLGMGRRIIFDPLALVDHFNAPREVSETRDVHGIENIFWNSHNSTYILLKHLPLSRKLCFLAYANVVGSTGSHGLISYIYSLRKGTGQCPVRCLKAAYRGRLHGLMSYLQTVRVKTF